MPLPPILAREFSGLPTCYRIPSRRARNYWEFLETLHTTFSRPWERYNAHLHFTNDACEAHISPSEWDAGGYFDKEFLVEGRVVVYVCFEEVEGRVIDETGEMGMEEEDDGPWNWETGRGAGLRSKVGKSVKYDEDDDLDEAWEEDDPYPPFPSALLDNDITAPSLPVTKTNPVPPPPPPEILTIDEANKSSNHPTSLIIGRAKPHCCADPSLRPVVRARLNKVGSVVAYIPRKYAKRIVSKGDVQIALKDVDFINPWKNISVDEKRVKAIRHALEAKRAAMTTPTTAQKEEELSGIPAADSSLQTAPPATAPSPPPTTSTNPPIFPRTPFADYIPIGHASALHCRHPSMPPVVRAMLNSKGAVLAFIPGAESVKPLAGERAVIGMENVVWDEEFGRLAAWRRSKVIRERILERGRASMGVREAGRRDGCDGGDRSGGGK